MNSPCKWYERENCSTGTDKATGLCVCEYNGVFNMIGVFALVMIPLYLIYKSSDK